MTTIAGFVDVHGRVAIAGDRLWSNRVGTVCQPKIRSYGGLVVGFTGSGSIAIGFEGNPEGYHASDTGCRAFAKDYRRFLVESGHVKLGDNGTNNVAGAALVVWPGSLRMIDVDGGILVPERYAAIGSGHDIAYGALHVAARMGVNAIEAVRWAVDAAVAHDLCTGGPVTVWTEATEPSRVEDVEVLAAEIRLREDERAKRRELDEMDAASVGAVRRALDAGHDVIAPATATHRCRVCGARWRLWKAGEASITAPESWSLVSSLSCGPCCDNVPMGDQIEALS